MPKQAFGADYAHEFPFGMAAAYGYHLAMNHAFRDANKRTAFAAMVVFLRMNGWNFEMPDEDAAGMMLEMIKQRRDRAWLGAGVMENSRQRPSMELRDFFRAINPKSFMDTMNAVRVNASGNSVDRRLAAVREAASSTPLIRQLIADNEAAAIKGDEHLRLVYSTLVYSICSLIRMAEDMGYEW